MATTLIPFKHGRASLAVMEGLDNIEEIDFYLEAAQCVNCHTLSSVNTMLENRIKDLESSLEQSEQRMSFMEENSIAWERKALEYEANLEILIQERGGLKKEMQSLESRNSKLLRDVEGLQTELERKPEEPPPPPPPPPPLPPKFRLQFWKPSPKKSSRSKSLNRVEDLQEAQQTPMALNSDILDAIKNRRYSLRHVDPAKEKEKKRRLRKEFYYSDMNIAKLLERQIALAFSEDEDSCEEEAWPKDPTDDAASFSSLDSNGSFTPRYNKKPHPKVFNSF